MIVDPTKLIPGARVKVIADQYRNRAGTNGTVHSIDADSVKIVMDDDGDIASTAITNVMALPECVHSGPVAEIAESRDDTRRIVQCCICKLVGIKELHALPDRPPFWIFNWATMAPDEVPEPQPSLIPHAASYRAGYEAGLRSAIRFAKLQGGQ